MSEEEPGKVEILKFVENETQSIVGKIGKFPIESCTWFFDRKVKDKTGADDTFSFKSYQSKLRRTVLYH